MCESRIQDVSPVNIVINGKKSLAFDCNTLAYRKGNDDNQFISVGKKNSQIPCD